MSVVRDPTPGPFDFASECLKSNFTLMHVFSHRKKAPPFTFSLFLLLWATWWGTFFGYINPVEKWALPESLVLQGGMGSGSTPSQTNSNADTEESGNPSANVSPPGTSSSSSDFLTRLTLHWLVPTSGFLRTCLICSHLLTLGYTYEVSSLGTTNFMLRFITAHSLLVVFLSFFHLGIYLLSISADPMTPIQPQPLVAGLEPTLAFMQVVFAFDNPIVANQVVSDDWLKLKLCSALEPRYHGWLLIGLMCMTGPQPWTTTFYRYVLACAMGGLFVLRNPKSWGVIGGLWKEEGSFLWTLGLWAFALLRWPVTSGEFGLVQFLFSPQSWVRDAPNSYLNLALFTEGMPEAFFLMSLGLSLIPLIILLLIADKDRFFWVKKVYAGISIILAMSIMNTKSWAYVEVGFLVLAYSIIGFITT